MSKNKESKWGTKKAGNEKGVLPVACSPKVVPCDLRVYRA